VPGGRLTENLRTAATSNLHLHRRIVIPPPLRREVPNGFPITIYGTTGVSSCSGGFDMKRYATPALFLIIALTACNFPQPGAATLSPQEIGTYAAQTAAAFLGGRTAPSATGKAQPTEEPPTPSVPPTPSATFTPFPTFTATHTVTLTPIPCNWAQYITDVTYPDDSKVAPSWTIEKTWRLKNIGSCTWTSGYQMIFDHGDRMDAPDWVPLTTGTVSPGETVEVTVTLHTPAADGSYQGYYKLRSADGRVFGIGADADSPFWIRVKVERKVDLVAEFYNVHHCGNFYSTTFHIGDAGNVGLESAQVRLINRGTSTQIGPTFTSDSPWLPTATSCLPGADGPIGPGSAWFLAVNFFPPMTPPPSGLEARAYIKACTDEGLGGDCVEKQVDFTYP
jgi:hypothetical protein